MYDQHENFSRFELVIFGATGFTGRHVVEEAVRTVRRGQPLSWAVAGRSTTKLQQLLLTITEKTGEDLSNVRVIVADVGDDESLKAMSGQAKVVANCCGPYRLHGEPVVRACIATRTHHVDITAELQFVQQIQLKYHDMAERAGVYVVSACGLDSIPNDMGVVYLGQNFQGVLNSVEGYMNVDIPMSYRKIGTSLVHYGTYASLIHILANWDERKELASKLSFDDQVHFKPELKTRPLLHKSNGKWFLPFLGADEFIVNRTQRFFQKTESRRPAQFKAYVGMPTLVEACMVYIVVMLAYWMSKFSITRALLLRYPKLFSLGFVSHEGPSEAAMNSTTFSYYLRGEGWESGTDVTTPPNMKMVAKVSGVNPGYGFTAAALLQSAVTILREQHKMPGEGGVLTTGMAFSKTSLVETLSNNNYTFQIVDE